MCLRHVRSCNSYSLGDHIYLSHEWTRDHASVVFGGFDAADNESLVELVCLPRWWTIRVTDDLEILCGNKKDIINQSSM